MIQMKLLHLIIGIKLTLNMIRLSIVIPIFNVENYLKDCLESIVHQLFNINTSDVEVLLINDGSTDYSSIIAKDYARNYKFIEYYEHDNIGLSLTRNFGLNVSSGEYVWFLDSDDRIVDNCIYTLINLCEEYKLDILSFDRIKYYSSSNFILMKTISKYTYKVISGIKCVEENNFPIPSQLYIFKKYFLISNRLLFEPNLFHEDKLFTLNAIILAERFFYSGLAIYFHVY